MSILLLVCLLSSLFPIVSSWQKLKQRYSEQRLALLLGTSLQFILLSYGLLFKTFIHSTDPYIISQFYATAKVAGFGMDDLNMSLGICSFDLSIIHIILYLIISRSKHEITYSLYFIIGLITSGSIIAFLITGKNPVYNFFMACCGVMAYYAWLLGLTYKEFCVLGNIYLQAGICLFTSFLPLSLCVRRRINGPIRVLSFINTVLHAFLFLLIGFHYWMPLDKGFNLCYVELNNLAKTTGTSYITVNIVIFVMLFLLEICMNQFIYKQVCTKIELDDNYRQR